MCKHILILLRNQKLHRQPLIQPPGLHRLLRIHAQVHIRQNLLPAKASGLRHHLSHHKRLQLQFRSNASPVHPLPHQLLAERVIIAMEHTNKGQPRILKECTLPLTAAGEVDLIVTERGVLEVTPKGLVLKEINPAFSLQEVINSTEADLIIADTLTEIAV